MPSGLPGCGTPPARPHFSVRLVIRGAGDEHHALQEFDVAVAAAPPLSSQSPHGIDLLGNRFQRHRRQEHEFCMAAGEFETSRRATGLCQHGCALWRRLHEIESFDAVALALMVDVMHLGGGRRTGPLQRR